MHINWKVKLVLTQDWRVYFYINNLKKKHSDRESSKINQALKRSRNILIYHTCFVVSTSFSITKTL